MVRIDVLPEGKRGVGKNVILCLTFFGEKSHRETILTIQWARVFWVMRSPRRDAGIAFGPVLFKSPYPFTEGWHGTDIKMLPGKAFY